MIIHGGGLDARCPMLCTAGFYSSVVKSEELCIWYGIALSEALHYFWTLHQLLIGKTPYLWQNAIPFIFQYIKGSFLVSMLHFCYLYHHSNEDLWVRYFLVANEHGLTFNTCSLSLPVLSDDHYCFKCRFRIESTRAGRWCVGPLVHLHNWNPDPCSMNASWKVC